MRNTLILLFWMCGITYSFSQTLSAGYSLTTEPYYFGIDIRNTSVTLTTSLGTYNLGSLKDFGTVSGTAVVSGIPSTIDIVDFSRNIGGQFAGICSQTVSANLSSDYCSGYSYKKAICNFVTFSVTFTPVIAAPTFTKAIICENGKLDLAASNGFDPYVWQYSTQTGIWNTISGFNSATASIGIQDIFGSNYVSHLNENIFFRYSVGNCDPSNVNSGQVGPFKFEPSQVTGSFTAQSPTCQNGQDASISVSSYSRPAISGETFAYEIHSSQDLNASSNAGVKGLKAGNYYGVVTSNFGCGSLVYVPITVPPGPRIPLSASLAITSNYNGAQISCNGSNDGHVTVATNGGGDGNYTYSLDGGAFQSSNVFSTVGAGGHSVVVKDGCTTPTTATTNSVTLTAPSAVSLTSAIASTCNGPSNGQITVTGLGGTGAYLYSDDGGTSFQSSNVFTNLATSNNSYDIRFKDANNCLSSVTNVKMVPPIVAGSVTPPKCSGATVTLSISGASGGSGNLKWEIYDQASNALVGSASSVANSITVAASQQRSYYAKVIDSSDPGSSQCSALTSVFTVNAPLAAGISQTSFISCFGQSTAALTATPSGGTSSYNYTWSNGVSTISIAQITSSLSAGTYSLTVTDANGCTDAKSITVSQPSQLSAGTPLLGYYNGFNISCKGGSDGTINLAPSGGTSPYSYSWSTGSTSQNLSGLLAGIYAATIKDANNCAVPISISLTEPPALSVAFSSQKDLTCFGANDGSIDVTGGGGAGTIWYSKDNWQTLQTSTNFSLLAAGTYTIRAHDANGCNASLTPITVNAPPQLIISSITKNNPLCNGSANGSISLSATGGTPSYSYANGGPFGSSNSFSGLSAESYIVSVRDAHGCTVSSSIQSLIDPPVLALSSTTTPQSCASIVDGSISLIGSGGTAPYIFSDDGGSTYITSGNFTGLTAGSYSTSVKDNNGCIATKAVGVNIQPLLTGTISQTSPINCYGQLTGALSINASGGTAPYSYNWSTGSALQNITGLGAGNYSVSITDSKNCTASQQATINQPTLLIVSSISSDYNGYGVSCKNSNDGFINLSGSGGTSPYTFVWNTGATTNSIAGLHAGDYSATIIDSKNCMSQLSVTLKAPSLLGLSSSTDSVTCNGGSDGAIVLSPSGGVGGYLYSINVTGWQSSTTFSALKAGSYMLSIKDNNGCTSTRATNVFEPLLIKLNIDSVHFAGCGLSNGLIQASATGGTGFLNFSWTDKSNQTVSVSPDLTNFPSGIYKLTVTDQHSCLADTTASISNPNGPVFSIIDQVAATCNYTLDGKAAISTSSLTVPFVVNWSNGQSGISVDRLKAGNSSVSVTDGNNCTTIKTFTTDSPAPISLTSVLANSPTCPDGSDGSIQVNTLGGSPPYAYVWNGNSGGSLLSGVKSGDYSLSVLDVNKCIFSRTVTVPSITQIDVKLLNQVTPSCTFAADGSLFVMASGGTGTLNYSWGNGVLGQQLNSIPSGDYTVTVTDSRNCSQQKKFTMTAPSPVSESLTATSAVCFGGSTGAIRISSSGGTGAYSYSKDNGASWQTKNVFDGLSAGNYMITTKDQNGCAVATSAVVDQSTPIAISISKIDPMCGFPNGSLQATIKGGMGVYFLQWMNSANQIVGNGSSLKDLRADDYELTVIDTANCSARAPVTLASYPEAQFSLASIASTRCNYTSDGSASVNFSSVLSPYSLLWSSGETLGTATQLKGGQNMITVTDINNCKFSKTFQVPSPQAITLLSESINNPPCLNDRGTIQVTATGGTGNLAYTWNQKPGVNNMMNTSGTYALVITDSNGCTFSKSYTLTDPPRFVIDLGPDRTICPNTTTAVGLTLPSATYAWNGPNNFASTNDIIKAGSAGVYQLTVTSANGCRASDNITISVSNNLLKADFLTVSKAHVGDTLAIIDISKPIPDQIKWRLEDGATVIYEDNDYALITFLTPGNFRIGIEAAQGGCQDEYFQTVSIDDRPSGGEAKRAHEIGDVEISSITTYPNPFIGRTNAKIELSNSATASVKIYSMATNTLIMSHEFEGDKNYNVEIDFNGLEAGLYIIIVESGSKKKAVRVVKL